MDFKANGWDGCGKGRSSFVHKQIEISTWILQASSLAKIQGSMRAAVTDCRKRLITKWIRYNRRTRKVNNLDFFSSFYGHPTGYAPYLTKDDWTIQNHVFRKSFQDCLCKIQVVNIK